MVDWWIVAVLGSAIVLGGYLLWRKGALEADEAIAGAGAIVLLMVGANAIFEKVTGRLPGEEPPANDDEPTYQPNPYDRDEEDHVQDLEDAVDEDLSDNADLSTRERVQRWRERRKRDRRTGVLDDG